MYVKLVMKSIIFSSNELKDERGKCIHFPLSRLPQSIHHALIMLSMSLQILEYLRKQVIAAEAEPMSRTDEEELINEIMKHEDKDRDGWISEKEFSGSHHDEL